MTRGDEGGLQFLGFSEESPKLDLLVTEDARIRCSGLKVFLTEILDYFLLELLFQVDDIEGDSQFFGNTTGIYHVGNATAPVTIQ